MLNLSFRIQFNAIVIVFAFAFVQFIGAAEGSSKTLPMKRILQSANRKALGPPSSRDFKRLSRQNRVYRFVDQKLKVIEASDFRDFSVQSREKISPSLAEADQQREADANDGDDITSFEEVGAPLTPEDLAKFSLCTGARLENGVCNKNAYWMAVLSAVAYLKYPLAFDRLKEMGFDEITFLESASDIELFVAKKKPQRAANGQPLWETGVTVVAFRGTDDPVDWLTNLKTTTVDISAHSNEAWLHQGFAEALEEVYPHLLNVLKLGSDKSPLYITGHSLGGALATQLAIRLVSREDDAAQALIGAKDTRLRGLYTFAIPRVGNAWARNILDHYMNQSRNIQVAFQNHSDPVTKVPFHWWGFRRSSLQVILPQKTMGDLSDRSQWQCFADNDYTGPSVASWDFWDQDVAAHYLSSYVKYVLPFKAEALQAACPDSLQWGARFAGESGFQELRTAQSLSKSSCDYSSYTWGGKLE